MSYALAFTACVVAFGMHVFRILVVYYSFGLDFAGSVPPAHLPVRQTLLSFAAALVLYAAAVADAYAAYRRACTTWAQRKLPRD